MLLLGISFFDVSVHDEYISQNKEHYEDLHIELNYWENLQLNQEAYLKCLVFGITIGCGIFSIVADLLFSICW